MVAMRLWWNCSESAQCADTWTSAVSFRVLTVQLPLKVWSVDLCRWVNHYHLKNVVLSNLRYLAVARLLGKKVYQGTHHSQNLQSLPKSKKRQLPKSLHYEQSWPKCPQNSSQQTVKAILVFLSLFQKLMVWGGTQQVLRKYFNPIQDIWASNVWENQTAPSCNLSVISGAKAVWKLFEIYQLDTQLVQTT